MSLIDLTNGIESLKAELKRKTAEFAEYKKSATAQLHKLEEQRECVLDGLDQKQILLAEQCLQFEGDPTRIVHGRDSDQRRESARGEAIKDAIKAIAESESALSNRYIGVKNYDGFGDQRADCEYGYGPKHGSIVFRIGKRKPKTPLTEEQREACIYYLINWKKIYSAKLKANQPTQAA